MILIDYNPLVIANLLSQIKDTEGLQEDLVRHMVLNSIHGVTKKFKNYGNVVIACDGPSYWRRDIFPHYKHGRRKDRESSDLDWNAIHTILHKIREEIVNNMPYKTLRVEGAEADDIIAILTKKYSPHEDVVIVSNDKDFVQLQLNKNVKQWSPNFAKFVQSDDPRKDKLELILRGDRSDGIPNVLSESNSFVIKQRQKSINSKKIDEWTRMTYDELSIDETIGKRFVLNRNLIDFDQIPEHITKSVVDAYDQYVTKPKSLMLNYFIENKLKNLISIMDEF